MEEGKLIAEEEGELLLSWCAGLGCFLFFFAGTHLCLRSAQYEVTILRSLIHQTRYVLGGCMLLLLPLFYTASQEIQPVSLTWSRYGRGGNSYSWGWGRPVVNLLAFSGGLFLDYHVALRWLCVLGLATAVAVDSMSYYELLWELGCIREDRCPLQNGFTEKFVRYAQLRDLAAVGMELWALLLALYLLSAVGACFTAYRYSQLQGGQHNRTAVMMRSLTQRKQNFA